MKADSRALIAAFPLFIAAAAQADDGPARAEEESVAETRFNMGDEPPAAGIERLSDLAFSSHAAGALGGALGARASTERDHERDRIGSLNVGSGYIDHGSFRSSFIEFTASKRHSDSGEDGRWSFPSQFEFGVSLLATTHRRQFDLSPFLALDFYYFGARVHAILSTWPSVGTFGVGAQFIARIPLRNRAPFMDLQAFVGADAFFSAPQRKRRLTGLRLQVSLCRRERDRCHGSR